MGYSLLFSNGERKISDAVGSIREAIYDLNIDRSVNAACRNSGAAEYFLSVLATPLSAPEDVSYRQAVLRDLIAAPKLLDGLRATFKGYDNLRSETEELAGGIFRYGASQSSAAMLDCAYERLYVSAHFARNVIAYIAETASVLSAFSPGSEGLSAVSRFCSEVSEDPLILEAERAAEQFKNETPENYRFSVKVTYDELMRMEDCALIEASQKKKERFNPLTVLKSRKKEEIPSSVDIGTSAAESADIAAAFAMESLADCYDALANGLYERLYGIGDELRFYQVALELYRYVCGAGMDVCYPEVLEAERDVFLARGLFDMLLINEGKDVSTIVKNTVDISSDSVGVLVRGDNNCGKTSFLRSVGCAQLFAQAGLFVCAEELTVSVRSGIFTHFSSAEKEFTDNDAAGRFEGEVKDVARILDRIRPYSLVMLNETFQTTAYREGAIGMKTVLDALPLASAKFIFVTHMLTVFELFGSEDSRRVTMLKTGEGEKKYSLIPFN